MSVSTVGAVLNVHVIATRLPVAFGVLGAVAVLSVAIASLSLADSQPSNR